MVVIVSSSAVYGQTPGEGPVGGRTAARPLTHHGTSQVAQGQIARRYARAAGLRIVVARTARVAAWSRRRAYCANLASPDQRIYE